MYLQYECNNEAFVAQIRELEIELGRPIRMVSNRYSSYSFADIGYEPDGGFTPELSNEIGITLVVYGAAGSSAEYSSEYYVHESSDFGYEMLTPNEEPVLPIHAGGRIVGEIDPENRMVYTHIASWYSYFDQPFIAECVPAWLEAIRCVCNPELLAQWDERMEAHRREALTRFIARAYDRNLTETRERIDLNQGNIAQWTTLIAEATRSMRSDQELLDAVMLQRENDAGEKIEREFELLKEHSRAESVEFSGTHIIITTTDDLRLHRPDTDESRWLGRFKIMVNLDNLAITAENLDTKRGGRDHPHITNGNPCFGGHSRDIAGLLGRGELYTVFELLIQYLETLNLEDEYGRYGAYWFEVEDERPLEAPAEAVAA